MNVGTEAEFFLFEKDDEGRATAITNDVAGYFSLDPEDTGNDCRREISDPLEQMGFEIQASHHEVAEGQHEINFKYSDALTAAENTITLKWVVNPLLLVMASMPPLCQSHFWALMGRVCTPTSHCLMQIKPMLSLKKVLRFNSLRLHTSI